MTEKDLYKKLVKRFIENTADEQERMVFFELLKEGKLDESLSEQADEDIEHLKIQRKAPVYSIFSNRRAVAAAVILFVLTSTAVFFAVRYSGKTASPAPVASAPSNFLNDIAPGGNKAILKLANGPDIILDSARKGTISSFGQVKVVKLADGQLAYEPVGAAANGPAQINTLSTPRGGQYQLKLEDGTRVWLNAASSIKFPSSFEGPDRLVEVTGEAYFEVAKNPLKPFKVAVNGSVVEVLGTHFNVNAYEDNNTMNVTLLEGEVKVSKGNMAKTIHPGQQAQLGKESIKTTTDINMEEVMAWKNGRFYFDGADIKTMMKQLEKWYDIQVVYTTNPSYSFVAKIGRDVNISDVLNIVQKTELVHFRIEGRVVTVLP